MSNNRRNISEKSDPMYLVIGGAAFIIFIVLFCVIVWNVTHRGKDDIYIDSSAPVTESSSSETPPSSTDVVAPVESSSAEESSEESGVDYNDTSNDMGLTFAEVDDVVTAKDVTNLRSEPSTAQGEATVVAKLRNGTTAVRIGKEDTTGWSKLVYEGQIVYASTNYLIVVEEEE